MRSDVSSLSPGRSRKTDLPVLRQAYADWMSWQRERGRRKLSWFIQDAWPLLEPKTQYVHNWHIDAICEHLEAVSRFQIRALIINIPPRCMKSLSVAVCWPAWHWIQHPEHRFLFASYGQHLSFRDGGKSALLLSSNWYRERWGYSHDLLRVTASNILNDKMGYRIATSVEGMGTGEGGDFVVGDDPHNVVQAESDTEREKVVLWWRESMSSRVNNPKKCAHVLVMQRVHARDVCGAMLEEGGYELLCLPMRYEPSRLVPRRLNGDRNPEYIPPTSLGFTDPRREEGELLWPRRYDEDAVSRLESSLGTYAAAGQLQQRPTPRGGGMFKRDCVTILPELPKDVDVERLKMVRSWDLAGTDPARQRSLLDPDYTVGELWACEAKPDPRFFVLDMVRFRADPSERDKIILQTAQADGIRVPVWIEQEPGQSGKSQIDYFRRLLPGWAVNPPRPNPSGGPPVRSAPPSGSKVQRAEPLATAWERGKVFLVSGPWNSAFLQEFSTFPMSQHKDVVDAGSQAFQFLSEKPLSIAELMQQTGYYDS